MSAGLIGLYLLLFVVWGIGFVCIDIHSLFYLVFP